MNNERSVLQDLCVQYLQRLRGVAERYGLGKWVDNTIQDNLNNKCKGTQEECELLARACEDDRLEVRDVPKTFGLSYRAAFEGNLFARIRRIPKSGTYSKVDALVKHEKVGKDIDKLKEE